MLDKVNFEYNLNVVTNLLCFVLFPSVNQVPFQESHKVHRAALKMDERMRNLLVNLPIMLNRYSKIREGVPESKIEVEEKEREEQLKKENADDQENDDDDEKEAEENGEEKEENDGEEKGIDEDDDIQEVYSNM